MHSPGDPTWLHRRLGHDALDARVTHELAHLDPSSGVAQLLRDLAAYAAGLEGQVQGLRSRLAKPQRQDPPVADLFDGAPIGYVLLDPKGRMRELNPRAARILGRELQDLANRHLGALLEPNQNGVLVNHLKDVFAAPPEPVVAEVQARTPHGPIWLRLESVALGGDEPRCRTALSDITAERAARDELHDYRCALVRAGRTRLVGEVASRLSHHLSEPLTALSLYLSMADPGRRGQGQDLEVLLRKARGQIQRATALLRRMRRVSRLRPQQIGRYDLAALVGRVLSYLEPDIRQCGVRVRLRGPRVTVAGDRDQLEQVFLNLLRNAVDAVGACERSERRIEITVVRHERGVAEICVADTGVGPPCDVHHLDALFAPLHAAGDGAGLALPFTRTLIEEHGGRLWAEPNHPRGARFVFTLPACAGA